MSLRVVFTKARSDRTAAKVMGSRRDDVTRVATPASRPPSFVFWCHFLSRLAIITICPLLPLS